MSRVVVNVREKCYPGSCGVALADLNFTVDSGEFVAILGPSGAGKSTLLNLVSGLDRQLDGEVTVDGAAVHRGEHPAGRFGFMFQEPRLLPWLTVLDNLLLVLDDGAGARTRALRLLEEVGLAECAEAWPGQLSGGMQRRVALARAFAVSPALLLMDEPFVSLDAPTAARLREQLTALWQERRPTVLFVTHDLEEALCLADRVLFLSGRPGRVVLELPVPLPRPRTRDDARVQAEAARLLATHPQLLSGLAETAEDPPLTLWKRA